MFDNDSSFPHLMEANESIGSEAPQDKKQQPAGNKQSLNDKKEKQPDAATRLVGYVLDPALGVELFMDEAGRYYITAPVAGCRQTWLIRSDDCRQWLTRVFYEIESTALNSTTRADALSLLESQARFGTGMHKVFVRIGQHEENIYLDLCNAQWQAVRIFAGGWEVVAQPPVKFRRPRGMQALPTPDPQAGLAALEILRSYLNVKTEDNWLSILVWMTHALLDGGPYAVLFLTGQPGVAKSTASRVVRGLIDPAAAELRDAPLNQRDFAIAAHNNWVLALDNLSYIPEWLSDDLCRLATGGGFATRQLYSDADEVQFDFCRPALLNAIEDVVTRSDLLQRLLTVELMPIAEQDRRKEEDFWKAFNQDRPQILGGLLTLTAQALAVKPTFQLENAPRMADFCHWGETVARVLGHLPGRFQKLMQANAANAAAVTLDATPLFGGLERFLSRRKEFVGTASQLLSELEESASPVEKRHPGWPRSANKLSGILRRIAANLKQAGIEYQALPRTGQAGRKVAVWLSSAAPPRAVVKAGLGEVSSEAAPPAMPAGGPGSQPGGGQLAQPEDPVAEPNQAA